MRELDCDFCGATAAGTYEIGPAPPERSPSDRRRLVLCADCRATLADAIQPLLDRLAAAEGDDPAATDAPTEDGATDPLGEGRASDERTVSEPDSDGAATDGVAPETDGAATDGVTPETDGAVTESESDTDEHAETDPDPEANGTTDTDETTNTADTEETEPPAEEPPQFRKVVRLLNNRSFPVEREEFVELAAGAYELEESAVAESLAYAVDRGVLAVEDGQIVRG